MDDQMTLSGPLAPNLLREALALAEELDQVRSVYGDECASFVKRALYVSEDARWHMIVENAVREWDRIHPRFNLDF